MAATWQIITLPRRGNRQLALALQGKRREDFNFQQDHRSDDPTDLIFIPHFPTEGDSGELVYAKSKYLAMLIGGAVNIRSHEQAVALELCLDFLIDWEKEARVFIARAGEILPVNPYEGIAEEYDLQKAKALRQEDFVSYAIYLSKHDRFVKAMLLLASQKYSFISLHSILDTLETKAKYPAPEGRRAREARQAQRLDFLCGQAAVSGGDLKTFTATANNFGVLGLFSRHGDKGEERPKRTVDLHTASRMILKLAYYSIYHHIDIDGMLDQVQA